MAADSGRVLSRRPVLFLDIDDTVCLHRPYGGYDVLRALITERQGQVPLDSHHDLWARLLDSRAIHRLLLLHEEFSPTYVLSTSWARIFDEASLRRILSLAGLGFVVSNLHEGPASTVGSPNARCQDMRTWLNAHSECAELWVVVGDERSGTGLLYDGLSALQKFIVICPPRAGLTNVVYRKLRDALLARVQSPCG
ncbi:HAD domain-containing protein [Variovorax saccharolyticus]|uniref:HAD domain-containing protein n=1 Tax=Variovorax saccharolyticus TaxID=3053516 RepID=UPI00336A0EB8